MKAPAKLVTLGLVAALVLAAPAAYGSTALTARQAAQASRGAAEQTLGTLLSESVGSATVRVSGCRVSGRRGVCRVTVHGTSSCTYTSHVLSLPDDYRRCRPPRTAAGRVSGGARS